MTSFQGDNACPAGFTLQEMSKDIQVHTSGSQPVPALQHSLDVLLAPTPARSKNEATGTEFVVALCDFNPDDAPGWPFPQHPALPLQKGQEVRVVTDYRG